MDDIPTNYGPEDVYDVTGWAAFFWLAKELGGEIVAINNGDGTFTYTIEVLPKIDIKVDK